MVVPLMRKAISKYKGETAILGECALFKDAETDDDEGRGLIGHHLACSLGNHLF